MRQPAFSRLPLAAVLPVALAVALSSCATGEVASRGGAVDPASISAGAMSDNASDDASDAAASSGEPTEAEEPAEPNYPGIGETVTVGDWDVEVTEIDTTASDRIAAANPFNENPKGQFILVTYDATYNGNERTADVFWDLTWTMTDSGNRIHDESSQVTEADDQEWPTETRPGGTVKGQAVFDLTAKQIRDAVLSVEDFFGENYADFTV